MKCSLSSSSAHEIPQQEYWSGLPFPTLGDLPNPGIKPRSPALQADSLPAEPPGKPKNTGVGSLSLLQGDLPDPRMEPGSLLHCRWILYQLSYCSNFMYSVFFFFFLVLGILNTLLGIIYHFLARRFKAYL